MNERVSIGGSVGGRSRSRSPSAWPCELWDRRSDQRTPCRRDELLSLWIESEVHRLTSMRSAANSVGSAPRARRDRPASWHGAELNKRIYELCLRLLGAEGMLYDGYAMRRPESAGGFGGIPQRMFLRSRANSIEGGTSEVMRNILGERVLGLPGDVRVDKGRPWTEIPRN